MKTLTEVIDALDTFLADTTIPGQDRCYLWGLLTALRGPDDGDRELKYKTTAVIRGQLFPKGGSELAGATTVFTDDPFIPPVTYGSEHFTQHIGQATRALTYLREQRARIAAQDKKASE